MISNIGYQLLILGQIVRAGFIRLPTLGTGSSKAEPICRRMYWRLESVASLPEVPYVPMKFDDSLPVIPPLSHL